MVGRQGVALPGAVVFGQAVGVPCLYLGRVHVLQVGPAAVSTPPLRGGPVSIFVSGGSVAVRDGLAPFADASTDWVLPDGYAAYTVADGHCLSFVSLDGLAEVRVMEAGSPEVENEGVGL